MAGDMDIAIAGFPRTAVTQEAGGLRGYRIGFRALGPKRAYLADRGGYLLAIGTAGLALAQCLASATPNLMAMLASVTAPLLCSPVFRAGLRWAFAGPTGVWFRPDTIEITKGGQTVCVDRALEHRFAAVENDNAEIETELLQDRARRKRKPGIFTPRYHHHAPHLVLSIDGNRIEVATIFGRAAAQRVLARLSACDAWMERQNQIGRPLQLTASDEQKPRPGGLPEDMPDTRERKGAPK